MEPHEKILAFVKAYEEAAEVANNILSGAASMRIEIFLQPDIWKKIEAEIVVEPVEKLWWNLGRYRLIKYLTPHISAHTYANGNEKEEREAA